MGFMGSGPLVGIEALVARCNNAVPPFVSSLEVDNFGVSKSSLSVCILFLTLGWMPYVTT